jgi:hypothetical protein
MCKLHELPNVVLNNITDLLTIQELLRLSLTCNELKQLIEFNYNLETTFFKKVLRQEPLCLNNIEPENKEYFMEY